MDKKLVKSLFSFMKKRLGFKENPKIIFKQDEANAKKVLGQTGYYDPQEKSITIFTTGRHEKDILRSLCHEIVHHSQNCQGKFRNIDMELIKDDYAQKNEQLRELEREAYEQGNLGLRDWEDSIKQGDDMKTDEAKEKLLEKIKKDREVPSYIKSRNQKKAELTWERYGFSLPKAEAGLLEESAPVNDVPVDDPEYDPNMMAQTDGWREMTDEDYMSWAGASEGSLINDSLGFCVGIIYQDDPTTCNLYIEVLTEDNDTEYNDTEYNGDVHMFASVGYQSEEQAKARFAEVTENANGDPSVLIDFLQNLDDFTSH